MRRWGRYVASALVAIAAGGLFFASTADAGKGCLACHEGIERFSDGPMQQDIEKMGAEVGDPAGCTVCHGGNPAEEKDKAKAHMGTPDMIAKKGGPKNFLPDPGAMPVNDQACGQCHAGYFDRLNKALMNTEAGKLQGNFWSWGLQKDMKVKWGNYDIIDEDGPVPSVGTKAYKKYMRQFTKDHPDQMPKRLKQIPQVNLADLEKNPNHAGITYSRHDCQRCHVGVQGRDKRGDYRGAGCSACHVPYSNEGYYEGNDPTINKMEAGHVMTHKMQATRKTKIKHNDIEYSGIPVETCVSCHNRGKRAGVSYQGLMEFPYGSPFDENGKKQPKSHTKKYLYIKADLHHEQESMEGNPKGGMLCQDCHTTVDMHGDGNIPGTTLAQVEVECEDCHGTYNKAPWELPLGRGEEFGKMKDGLPTANTEPRGLGTKWPEFMKDATQYPAQDGYLLTTRGNPFGNVVKKGDEVIVHSAGGLDFKVPILKTIGEEGTFKSTLAKVAMFLIPQHQNNMECYACHADWVPQCYGCHVTVDYSEGKTGTDWLINGSNRDPKTGQTPDAPPGTNGMKSPGKVSETRSYLRWEVPVLGMNGEGRVSPMMPGCQVVTTVIGPDGKNLVNNKIWDTPEGPGIDTAAVQPHTAGRSARGCESCHDNPKALGYGTEGNRFLLKQDKDMVVDLMTSDGKIISKKAKTQIQGIPGLTWDWSAILDEDGNQLTSVGSHWPLAGPLPEAKRGAIEKSGVCLGCHEERFDPDFWKQVAEPGVMDSFEHQEFMKKALEAIAKMKKMKKMK
ncbi:multiheme c-type cytochrome [Magnetococcus sp. PR-3]|uniref:multiheme c-type cytochrome n=1 Tax=Magnetococcus sp. PR-3 TaxID=3120355 RepID=UPI002FCE1799